MHRPKYISYGKSLIRQTNLLCANNVLITILYYIRKYNPTSLILIQRKTSVSINYKIKQLIFFLP